MKLVQIWASSATRLAGRRVHLAGPEPAEPEAAVAGADRTTLQAVVAVSS